MDEISFMLFSELYKFMKNVVTFVSLREAIAPPGSAPVLS